MLKILYFQGFQRLLTNRSPNYFYITKQFLVKVQDNQTTFLAFFTYYNQSPFLIMPFITFMETQYKNFIKQSFYITENIDM